MGFSPYRSATDLTVTPDTKDSAMIRPFIASDQRRWPVGPAKTFIRLTDSKWCSRWITNQTFQEKLHGKPNRRSNRQTEGGSGAPHRLPKNCPKVGKWRRHHGRRVMMDLIKPYIAERLCTPVTCLREGTDCLGKSGLGLAAQRKAVAVPVAGTVMCGSGLGPCCGWQEMRDVYRSPKPVPFATPPCANLLNKIRSYRCEGLRIMRGCFGRNARRAQAICRHRFQNGYNPGGLIPLTARKGGLSERRAQPKDVSLRVWSVKRRFFLNEAVTTGRVLTTPYFCPILPGP